MRTIVFNCLKFFVAAASIAFVVIKIWQQMANCNFSQIDFNFFALVAMLLLLPANWLIESKKWQMLTAKFQTLTCAQATKSVLVGLSTSMLSPNRITDFVGRLLFFKKENYAQGIICSIINSYTQTLAVVGLGIVATIVCPANYWQALGISNRWLVVMVGCVLLFVATALLVALAHNAQWLCRIKFMKNLSQTITVFGKKQLIAVLAFSVVRVLVFSFQFLLMLWALNLNVDFTTGFCAVLIMYAGVTIIPTFALAEIGVRSSVALLVLQCIIPNAIAITLATVLVWFVNVAIPATVGSVLLLMHNRK